MTETYNENPRQDILWSPPAPLHVEMARDAIAEFKRVQNAKDEARKHLLETKA